MAREHGFFSNGFRCHLPLSPHQRPELIRPPVNAIPFNSDRQERNPENQRIRFLGCHPHHHHQIEQHFSIYFLYICPCILLSFALPWWIFSCASICRTSRMHRTQEHPRYTTSMHENSSASLQIARARTCLCFSRCCCITRLRTAMRYHRCIQCICIRTRRRTHNMQYMDFFCLQIQLERHTYAQ